MATECNHNCQRKCPCPEACELPIQFAEDEPLPSSFAFVIWMVVCIVILALVSFIAGLAAGSN